MTTAATTNLPHDLVTRFGLKGTENADKERKGTTWMALYIHKYATLSGMQAMQAMQAMMRSEQSTEME